MADREARGAGAALQAVITALEPLEENERRRILDAAATFFGAPQPTPPAPGATNKNLDKPPGTGSAKPLSVNELLDEVKPSTNPQRIAAFAFFREQHEGNEKFARGDLKAYFSKAKESEPKNYDRDFNQTVKEGWIHEDGDQSYLTRKGESVVRAGFGGKAKPRGSAVAAKRGKRKQTA